MNFFEIMMIVVVCAVSAAAVFAKIRNISMYQILKPAPLLILVILTFYESSFSQNGMFYGRIISVGLLFGLIGDMLLLMRGRLFAFGILSFMIGHIFYTCAFLSRSPWISGYSFIPLIPVIAFIYLFQKKLEGEKRNIIPMIIPYFGVILFMCFCAFNTDLSNMRFPGYGIAAFIFCASDALLVWGSFIKNSERIKTLVLLLYYPAQIIIAFYTMYLIK
jgi:alkenylglycerophosphocholine hydrolase